MKFNYTKARLLTVVFSFATLLSLAQQDKSLHFKSGSITLEDNVKNDFRFDINELVNNNYYRIIQFSQLPTTTQKLMLKAKGIDLLGYLPDNAFYTSIKTSADLNMLTAFKVTNVVPVSPLFKLNKVLSSGIYPDWAMVGNNTIEISGIYYSNISEDYIFNTLNDLGAEIVISNQSNVVRFRVKVSDLENIYKLPEFYYFEEKDMPGKPEGIEDRTSHRSNTISTEYAGGLKFDGTGVTVMLQDNSRLDQHIDYTGRFTNNASATNSGDHGEHTGGIVAGAGNLDPKGRGMAYGADVLVYGPSNGNFNAVPALVTSNDLTITSKSYGNGLNAGYTTLTRQLDQQVRNNPSLIHVFSAGNSGSGWSTITGGHKQGKNVLAVGNVTYTDALSNSSSRGPALDGRIKPDICAVGSNVYSTIDPNNYGDKSGTSMACPGVAGVLAQLYHGYKTINGGINPNAALVKAAVLNTAEDLGNPGPDFRFGWGRINARRAYGIISSNNYLSDTISQGGANSHTINVPAATEQLRVMVYWSDYEGVASATPALVNNIDMQVIDPSTASFDPWILNPSSQNSTAIRGVDNLNNMEQVTIDNPAAGAFTVNINGTTIPQGPQEYYIVYEFIQDEVTLTYPIGNEGFSTGTIETIRWDSYGGVGTFNLEYSANNGASWNAINAAVSSTRRYFNWSVPNVVSGEVLVRVTRGAISSMSNASFSIIRTPTNLNIDWVCPDSLQMSWNNVTGATGYEVSMLGNKYMDSIGVTNTNSYVFHGTVSTQTDWFSVRALGATNARGERAIAIEKPLGTFSCPINVDASLTNVDPANNSTVLSCIPNSLNVVLTIKNEGLNPISNVPVHYVLNGASAVNETYTGTLASGAIFNYTFTSQMVPINGVNNLVVWNDIVGDGNYLNDSLTIQFTFANSTAQTIPWGDDFESFSLCSTSSTCETVICPLGNNFINTSNGNGDDIDWRTDRDGTPTGSSGPTTDFNPGNAPGKYLYLEASGTPVCSNKQANLISPCIDLTNAVNPELNFAYHMRGTSMGSLHVDILVNGVWANDITSPLNGDQGSSWLVRIVPLSAYIGNIVNIRMRGITGGGFSSDMAIDDIKITGTTVGLDELEDRLSFNIYPNPSNGIFNYSYSGEEALKVQLYDVNGRVIYNQNIKESGSKLTGLINIETYTDGIYMLVLTSGDKRITKRVVKR